MAAAQTGAHLLDVKRALGHEDRIGAAGDPRISGDPAGVATHHLDHHHTVVRLRGGVQPVDRIGGYLHGGLKAEGEIGGADVVVDRLGHTNERQPLLAQAQRHAERVLAADRDQRVQALALEGLLDPLQRTHATVEGVGARGAEDRAAARQYPRGAIARELDRVLLEHARPAVAKADEARLAQRRSRDARCRGSRRSGPGSRRRR